MSNFFIILFLLSFLALLIGLISPKIVIKWGSPEKRTRGKVFKFYGLTLVASFILFAVTSPEEAIERSDQYREQKDKQEKKVESEIASQEVVAQKEAEEKAEKEAEAQKEAEEKAEKEAEAQKEEEEKAKKEAEAKKKAEEKAKQKEKEKAKKIEKIKNPDWNTEDMYGDSNGNIELAAKILALNEDISQIAISPAPGEVIKSPWNFYGEVVKMNATVEIAQDYPPNHDFSKIMGSTASQIVLLADDGTILDLFMPMPSGDLQVGQYVTIYGYPVGLVEVVNQMGGNTTQLMLAGNKYIIH